MRKNNCMMVCLNASNLHHGGGVQVASSFLTELSSFLDEYKHINFTVFISVQVKQNLRKEVIDGHANCRFHVLDVFGLDALKPSVRKIFNNYDLIFTIFGPDYLTGLRPKRIVGFAQPWIIYPDNDVYPKLPFFQKYKTKLKFFIQKKFFKGVDGYIVELEHVKKRLIDIGVAEEADVSVVYNTVSNYYLPETPGMFPETSQDRPFKIGIISRNYPHKNIEIFPEVKNKLQALGLDVEFYVTFTDNEFYLQSIEFRHSIINLGPQKVQDCRKVYESFDGVIFPSLLECFSASPLEAMASCRPLFASDRPFNRDICGEFAYYFDPLDSSHVASVVADYVEQRWGKDRERLTLARKHALQFSNPRNRARSYLEIINKVVS